MSAREAAREAELPPEEAARADSYGLLARLFYAPPDRALLTAIVAGAPRSGEEGGVVRAWRELAQAAAAAEPETLSQEYDDAFVGAGKAPVSLYAGAYLQRYASETPLADLREDLGALGLARREGANEPEDHIAGLCEVMRHLVCSAPADLDVQRRFFERWIWPASAALCNAIYICPSTVFYRLVGRLAETFFEVEHAAFEMI